jgi:hypothetical protein
MASGASKRRIQKSTGPQELNLIPIMNLFITIIPMLLIITVTVHMAMLSLNLSASASGEGGEGDGNGASGDKVVEIKIVIYPDKFEVREEGNEPVEIPLITTNEGTQKFDYFALDALLTEIKERNPEVYEIKVTPYPDVFYDTLIRAIDVSKVNGFPEVKYERLRVIAI